MAAVSALYVRDVYCYEAFRRWCRIGIVDDLIRVGYEIHTNSTSAFLANITHNRVERHNINVPVLKKSVLFAAIGRILKYGFSIETPPSSYVRRRISLVIIVLLIVYYGAMITLDSSSMVDNRLNILFVPGILMVSRRAVRSGFSLFGPRFSVEFLIEHCGIRSFILSAVAYSVVPFCPSSVA